MEQENRGMNYITWKDIIERIEELKLDKSLKYYGVPRGGQPIAALLNPVDTPEEADVIIDDLVESGATKDRYQEKYPDKEFIALYHKIAGEDWLVFPWEVDEAPAEDNMVRILEFLNEDPNREGLMETPKRYLKFMKEFLSPPEFNFTCFTNDGTDDMIVQKNIPFYSLCEHHLAPFFGVAHVAYIPKGKIVGLSKLARTVELYARRLQNQERITHLVAERLMKELNPLGVAVVLEAEHLCMAMRGVKKHGVTTITSKMLGPFFDDPKSRSEFMELIKN